MDNTGKNFEEVIAAAKYQPRNLIAFLINYSKDFFDLGEKLRPLIEKDVKTVTGFNNNFTLEYDKLGVPASIDWEVLDPRMVWDELDDRSVEKVLREAVEKHLESGFTFDVLFVEPDATHTKAITAWVCTKMYITRLQAPESSRYVKDSWPYQNNTGRNSETDKCLYEVTVHLSGDKAGIQRGNKALELANVYLNQLVPANPDPA